MNSKTLILSPVEENACHPERIYSREDLQPATESRLPQDFVSRNDMYGDPMRTGFDMGKRSDQSIGQHLRPANWQESASKIEDQNGDPMRTGFDMGKRSDQSIGQHLRSANWQESESRRGILTLYPEDDLLKCKLRLYDCPPLDQWTKIGVYHNGEVYKSNLLLKNGVYTSSLVGEFDMRDDFYVAIVDTSTNTPILAGGTYSAYFVETDDENSPSTIESRLPQDSVSRNDIMSQPNEYSSCHLEERGICHPERIYSREDLQHAQSVDCHADTQSDIMNNETISSIMSQFEYIYANYTADEILNSKIENSRFVRIQEGDDNYSIGAIYENEKIKYMCYAVKTKYNASAPAELGEHYQWLPIDSDDPLSDGYYIVYQDAEDLKIIEV